MPWEVNYPEEDCISFVDPCTHEWRGIVIPQPESGRTSFTLHGQDEDGTSAGTTLIAIQGWNAHWLLAVDQETPFYHYGSSSQSMLSIQQDGFLFGHTYLKKPTLPAQDRNAVLFTGDPQQMSNTCLIPNSLIRLFTATLSEHGLILPEHPLTMQTPDPRSLEESLLEPRSLLTEQKT